MPTKKELQLEAAHRGEKLFTTGQPCKYGHTAMRYTTSGGCVECQAQGNGEIRKALQSARA